MQTSKNNLENKRPQNNKLLDFVGSIIGLLIISIFWGYIGYTYCFDNNYNLYSGIIFGSLFPIGLYFLKHSCLDNIFIYITYFIIYICVFDEIPILVGFIIWILVVFIFTYKILCFLKETKKANEIVNYTSTNSKYKENTNNLYAKKQFEDTETIDSEECKYYCDRCEEEITEEEYEEFAGLCEDCYSEVNFMPRYKNDDFDIYR